MIIMKGKNLRHAKLRNKKSVKKQQQLIDEEKTKELTNKRIN